MGWARPPPPRQESVSELDAWKLSVQHSGLDHTQPHLSALLSLVSPRNDVALTITFASHQAFKLLLDCDN